MSDSRYLHLIRQDCQLPPGTHVVAYCRDSGGEEQERSTLQQVDVIREYCAHHNLILDQFYVDDAKEAGSTEHRTQLQQMLTTLRTQFRQINDRTKRRKHSQNAPFGVIFWKSNRLGRDSIETRFIKADLRLRTITIIDLNRTSTGDTGADAVLEAFHEWQDETFLDDAGENASRGLASIVGMRDNDAEFRRHNPEWPTNDGRYLGIRPGIPPKGFHGESIKIGIRERKRRRGVESEAHIVQRIVPDKESGLWARCRLAWEMRREGKGIAEIMKVTRLYGTATAFTAFFGNRIYTGDFAYGGKVYENFVEPLIPREWWEDEQKKMTARSEKQRQQRLNPKLEPRRIASRHLLTGLVFCNHVDGEEHPMLGDTITENDVRKRWDFYICSVKKNSRGKKCDSKRISTQALNKAVVDKLMSEVLTHANLRPLADNLAQAMVERNLDAEARITAARSRLDEVRASIARLMDAIEKSGHSFSIQQRLETREAEQRELLAEITRMNKLIVKPSDIPKISDEQLTAFIDNMRETLMSDDVMLARAAIARFVAKVVVNGKTGTLYYTFPFHDITRNETLPLWGLRRHRVYSLEKCAKKVIRWLSDTLPAATADYYGPHPKAQRNELIRQRYANGENIPKLAIAFDLSRARIHQILHGQRK
ncbi:MAG: recombinase family protein [Anaerolineae bacterium]|nr:recombinase family protein [Anaerolineae bacterium]